MADARTTAFSSPAFHRLQRRHFLLFDVLPAVVTMGAVAALPWHAPGWIDLASFGVLWLVTGLGLTVGFHRYFSHRAFEAERPVALALLVMGSMAARGPMISWVAMHRRHHERSDREGDLHSPNLVRPHWRGWLHSHIGWMYRHDYPNVVHYTPDILRDRQLMRFNRLYHLWVALGLAAPALAGGLVAGSLEGAVSGLVWGGFVRIFVVEHTMSTINSFCHLVGDRTHATRDESRNIAWAGLVTWGESHHNNHHSAPASASFGEGPRELDPGYWFIRALEAMSLVSNVRLPKRSARIAEE